MKALNKMVFTCVQMERGFETAVPSEREYSKEVREGNIKKACHLVIFHELHKDWDLQQILFRYPEQSFLSSS